MTEEKKKKDQTLIRFHSANKIDNYNLCGEKKKRKKIQNNLQNKSKYKNNKCFSWVTAVRVLSLAGSHSPPQLPSMPSNTGLVSGRDAGQSESEVAQSCPTLCDPMDCSLPGSSVQGIFQAIVLEWITISLSRGSSQPRVEPRSPTL